ncbi:hypothetical protein BV898_09236 [Hypsibius exemplaris]|uniref:DDE-1 domain-containing protein n=1 Tax=Hypsibius exemplaris TaxID=2072580 RepID=A0A1W0WMW8_HYPEX|nr:hypothetical protein BV898_09236 [Hypsibius exemplaris]
MSPTWHNDFLKRHPTVAGRISQAENRKKARQWTDELCLRYIAIIARLKTDGYMNNPAGLWNLDESGFALGGRFSKVYARKGTKEVLSYFDGDDRTQLTVLACGSAAGQMLAPLVLLDGVQELASRVENTEDKVLVCTNKSGWMDDTTFTSYVKNVLIPSMPQGKSQLKLAETLESGFRQTGLYPFNEQIIKQTVPKVSKPIVQPVVVNSTSMFDEEQILRGSLGRLGLPHEDINATISSIHRKLNGHSAGYEIAESMKQAAKPDIARKETQAEGCSLGDGSGKNLE